MTDPRARILDEARACLGMGGPEPWAREAGIVGASKSVSWCGLFVRAVWRRAGLTVRDWKIGEGNVATLRKTTTPEPGDLVCWRGKNGHQSLFVREDEGMIVSLDGNTTGRAPDGTPVYSTVAEKRRASADVLAYYSAPIASVGAGPVPSPARGGTESGLPSALTLGVDVSAWQPPASMNWALLRSLGYSFAYIRGVKMGREIDVHAAEHVQRARDAGFRVGLYSFFSPNVTALNQISLALGAHAACGMRVGDLAPALDLESHTGAPCQRFWAEQAQIILDSLRFEHGAALRYHNVADWFAMGKPSELEAYPLWLADYTPPADLPCVVWQQRSAPIAGYGSTKLDQNAALGELPTIGPRVDDVRTVEPSTLPDEIAIPWVKWDRAEHARLRNLAVARHTDEEPP